MVHYSESMVPRTPTSHFLKTLSSIDLNKSVARGHTTCLYSVRYKSVTGPKTTVELFEELRLVRRMRAFGSCSGSLGSESGPFVLWPLKFERSCVTSRSSLEHEVRFVPRFLIGRLSLINKLMALQPVIVVKGIIFKVISKIFKTRKVMSLQFSKVLDRAFF